MGHYRKKVSESLRCVYRNAPLRGLLTGGETVIEQGV